MYAIQLDFFQTKEEAEIAEIRRLLEQVRQSSDKVRRGTYARLNELAKENLDLKLRLEILERNICKGVKM